MPAVPWKPRRELAVSNLANSCWACWALLGFLIGVQVLVFMRASLAKCKLLSTTIFGHPCGKYPCSVFDEQWEIVCS